MVLTTGFGKWSDRLIANTGASSGRRRNMIGLSMLIASVILIAPFVGGVWTLLALVTISLTGIASTTALNFDLLTDLLVNPKDIGRAMGFLVVGGNVFGMMAPIVTGYVIALTGSYNWAFLIAGMLLIAGATITLTMTRRPMAFTQAVAA